MTSKINKLLEISQHEVMNKNVLYFWSGGNDSSLLLRMFLHENIMKYCRLTIIVIPFPQHCYSTENFNMTLEYFKGKGIDVKFLATESKIDENIPYSDACPLCKRIRRDRFLEYFNPIVEQGDVIITGHNLSDLMSYYIEMHIMNLKHESQELYHNRYLEVSNKFLQSYIAENDVVIFRPLLHLLQSEVNETLKNPLYANYPLEIITKDCFWGNQRKRLLQDYFFKASVEPTFDSVYALMSEKFGIPSLSDFRTLPFDTYLL